MRPANNEGPHQGWRDKYSAWCSSVEQVKAEYLGEATEGAKQCVVCASFNAG